MTVVFIEVKDKLYLFFCLFQRGAESVAAAELALERGSGRPRVLAGLGFEANVSVRGFSVDLGGHSTVL